MPWNNFPFMFSLCDLLSFVSLLALKPWTSFQRSRRMLRRQQTLLGSNSAASRAWLCCAMSSEPHDSSANPECPCWLQGLSRIMHKNQQQAVPWPGAGGAATWAGGAAWQDGLCSVPLSPAMISLLAKAAKGWANACWGKYANVSFLSFNPC